MVRSKRLMTGFNKELGFWEGDLLSKSEATSLVIMSLDLMRTMSRLQLVESLRECSGHRQFVDFCLYYHCILPTVNYTVGGK